MFDSNIDTESFNPKIFYLGKVSYNNLSSPSNHFHPYSVIMFVSDIEGICKYRIEGNNYDVTKGSIIICNPAVYHEKLLEEGSSITEHHLAFEGVHIDGFPPDSLIGESSHMVVNQGSLEERFNLCFSELSDELSHKGFNSDIIVKAIAIKLIILTLRAIHKPAYGYISESSSGKGTKKYISDKLRRFINQNYHKDISLEKIAKDMHITPAYLSRIFKSEIGESPVNYLIKLRMSMACELLKRSDHPVSSIAKSVGYDDSYYFSKLFKKYNGVSPSYFRKIKG